MTEKHTPGPWRIDKLANVDCGYGRYSGAILSKEDKPVVIFDPSESEYAIALDPHSPNARLIAAAPELLAVLQGLVKRIDMVNRGVAESVELISLTQAARALLARATGKETT